MGAPESCARRRKSPAARRRRRRPRLRHCLLKGCEQRFHPQRAAQRYCSAECRAKARKWSRWKAQQRYRVRTAGQAKRNGQSKRYRERVKSRKSPESESVNDTARVITKAVFFPPHLRPAGMLRAIRASTAKSVAAFLLRVVPTSAGAGSGTGTALEAGAHIIRTY